MIDSTLFGFISGFLVLLYALFLAFKVNKAPNGDIKMNDIAKAIQVGANAFLKRQYMTIVPIVIILAAVIGYFIGLDTSISFVFGVILSALAGYIGMQVSVRANVRVAEGAKSGLSRALELAFSGGAVTGMSLIGLGLMGVSFLYWYFGSLIPLIGFGFGASLISLFARVGGGIYTKAADVGADLVGKIEKGIPEDDPRNPAVIADNVGDNVGDCAGMAADVFESFVVTIIAAMIIGSFTNNSTFIELPLYIASIGGLSGIIGSFFVRLGKEKNIMGAFYKGIIAASIVMAISSFIYLNSLFPSDYSLFISVMVGVVLTGLMFLVTEYYTSYQYSPVKQIAESSKTGAGTNLISGLAIGMQSTALPLIFVVLSIAISYHFAGMYGIALAAAAMLSLSAIVISVDSYGPITDNAGGIAEMSGLSSKVRTITDALDAVGNTTKATTKGFAIAGAALGALALFVAFANDAGLATINLLNPAVTIGLFIGALLPFLFSSFLMTAVGKAAFEIVEEVRRQFKTIKGLMSGKEKPDYATCVDISTKSALRELIVPGLLAVLTPLLIGYLLGAEALAGLLAGTIASGFLLALFMCTSGAAWDNGKKYIELGNFGGKGSDAHKAAIVGDTVGDPLKDTAGPALNALIKVVNTVSLVFIGVIMAYGITLLG
ncbi:MAG: sodium-translocating pyrophosphatase [Candidatus Micrarchaeia archaeon]